MPFLDIPNIYSNNNCAASKRHGSGDKGAVNMSVNFRPILLQQVPYHSVKRHFDCSIVTQERLLSDIESIQSLLSGPYLERFLVDFFKDATEYDDKLMELSFSAPSLPTRQCLYFEIDTKFICIRSSNYMVTHGTTGAQLWEAGVALGEFLVHNRSLIQGKQVLELGCGTGFCGIVASTVGAAAVTVTDQTLVLQTCTKQNISENMAMLELDWRYPETASFSAYDVVIASDVIFDPEIVPCLAELLVLAHDHGLNIIVCQKIRNPGTFKVFLDQLGKHKVFPIVVDVPPCDTFYYDSTNIKLITF